MSAAATATTSAQACLTGTFASLRCHSYIMASSTKSLDSVEKQMSSVEKQMNRTKEQMNGLLVQFGKLQECMNKAHDKFEKQLTTFGELIMTWRKEEEEIRKEQERKIVTLRVDLEKFKREIQANPNMEDNKSEIRKLEENLGFMKQQTKNLKDEMVKLSQEQQQQQQQWKQQQQQQKQQEQQEHQTKHREQQEQQEPHQPPLHTAPTTASSFIDICNELEQRQNKRKNLVVFGRKEGSKSDMEIALQLLEDVGVSAQVQGCFRLGKQSESLARSRPIVIKFASVEEKNEVQKSLRYLKGKNDWNGVSIRPDLTKIQYQEEKKVFEKLYKEMKIKNESLKGEGKWRIVNRWGVQQLVLDHKL